MRQIDKDGSQGRRHRTAKLQGLQVGDRAGNREPITDKRAAHD
jgi:hypothetical protein